MMVALRAQRIGTRPSTRLSKIGSGVSDTLRHAATRCDGCDGCDGCTNWRDFATIDARQTTMMLALDGGRLLNTNVDGKIKIQYALTQIKGVGRRYSNIVCKKADIDLSKRAGELNSDELERIVTILQNPAEFKIPAWFLNRQKDIVDGKNAHILSNGLDSKLRDDLERLKKIKAHRGIRHYLNLRVRGQHTKTTGRRGRTVANKKK
ncbi:uncharacterized protein PFL1_00932 [Pseudozyma flocculosa PF-1]|uniref:uncharacterized protein n=1 Tax=Pseudozyma flocculosa PF-1 TaxID=1277687 RepID=UPI000456102B|nr:uncharacterized protein PFL1_00932 [Pseudozyma flocculosa PF-1]EPQ31599.1 hypothetical protein PFL1_00932 [Pseudozyma flocculosa PF-1]